MTEPVKVDKYMTNVVRVCLPYDVSEDLFTSKIREGKRSTTPLIAEWDVTFETDGKDGVLLFTLDDSVTSVSPVTTSRFGYMDCKRSIGGLGGEPVKLFDSPLQVSFREVITE